MAAIPNCPLVPPDQFLESSQQDIYSCTPLLIACHYGNLDSVKRIVECRGVDVRAASSYYLDSASCLHSSSRMIKSATPLFVAAFRGYSKVVRYLLEKGADVTALTSDIYHDYDGLTPLLGCFLQCWECVPRKESVDCQRTERDAIACSLLEYGADPSVLFSRLSEMGLIWKRLLCGVEATKLLIHHGMDVEGRDPQTKEALMHFWATPPYYCSKEDSLAIIKLLVEKGADLSARDDRGFTPILRAAKHRNFVVLDFMLERDEISKSEKIDAMELAGAIILYHEKNALCFQKAFDYWRRALLLRQTETEGSYSSHLKKLRRSQGVIVEWATEDELEHVIQHSSEYFTQSFLVRLRILSSMSWKSVNSFLDDYFRPKYHHSCKTPPTHDQLLCILWAALDVFTLFDPRDEGIWKTTLKTVRCLERTLHDIERDNPSLLNVETIKESLHLLLLATEKLGIPTVGSSNEKNLTEGVLSLMFLLIDLPMFLTDDISKYFVKLLRSCRSQRPLGILLRTACSQLDVPDLSFNSLVAARLLLQAGADPNSFDYEGNGPLHFVARLDLEKSEAIGCLLLRYGAQLHRPNIAGKTALDVWIDRNEAVRPDWCRTVPKLSCLSARCIRVHKVPHSKLPTVFHPFVEKH